jgi:hypothetical protein
MIAWTNIKASPDAKVNAENVAVAHQAWLPEVVNDTDMSATSTIVVDVVVTPVLSAATKWVPGVGQNPETTVAGLLVPAEAARPPRMCGLLAFPATDDPSSSAVTTPRAMSKRFPRLANAISFRRRV